VLPTNPFQIEKGDSKNALINSRKSSAEAEETDFFRSDFNKWVYIIYKTQKDSDYERQK